MKAAWEVAAGLLRYPELADLLAERHRIIANDWQAAYLSGLIARLLRRAVQIMTRSSSPRRRDGSIWPIGAARSATCSPPQS